MAYKVVTLIRSDDEIMEHILKMYEGLKTLYSVYKNDELIKVINAKEKTHVRISKRILEVSTGTIFKDLTEMKDVLLIDRKKALELVKKSFNYRYV